MLSVRNNWLSRLIAEKQDSELNDLFAEIYNYRECGILEGSLLRGVDEEIRKSITHTPGGEMLRQIEDAVLFEMARRRYNAVCATAKQINDGDIVYYADSDGIEKGIVCNVLRDKEGKLLSFGVDFGNDFDEFCGSALDTCIFRTKEAAENRAAME